MAIEVKVPKISEGVESAQVAEVLVSEGDTIEEEQSIIAVETDKASVEIPSSDGGKIKEIKVKEGDEIKVGDVILVLEGEGEGESEKEEEEFEKDSAEGSSENEEDEQEEKEEDTEAEKREEELTKKKDTKEEQEEDEEDEEDEDDEDEDEDEDDEEIDVEEEEDRKEAGSAEGKKKKKEKKKEKKKKKNEDKKEARARDKKEKKEREDAGEKEGSDKAVPASPGVRRLARELDVEIRAVKGSGPGGRITEEDVKSQTKEKKPDRKEKPDQLSLPDFSKWGITEREPLSKIRLSTAKILSASWQAIPQVTQFDQADISDIEKYREKNSKKVEEAGGKLTITAILVKIVANALQQFPKFNASIDLESKEVVLKRYIHIGMAVDTEKGLLVPVIRDVDQKSITEIAVEISELAEKARRQELSPDDMQGGNFSVSNLGGIGGTNFTPLVYHPQVAILGISRASIQPVFIDGKFEPRQILPLSLSYDHRLIDGAEGAIFLNWIRQALEDPYKALLGA